MVQLLCSLGADIAHSDACNSTVLHTAVTVECSVSLLRFLLQQRGMKVNQMDKW
jgi:hypothetical protein